MTTREKLKETRQEEARAIAFVEEIQKQFTTPIVENIDKFLDTQGYVDEAKANFRKTLMITIANSILFKSNISRKELKSSYRGLINDFDKLKK